MGKKTFDKENSSVNHLQRNIYSKFSVNKNYVAVLCCDRCNYDRFNYANQN